MSVAMRQWRQWQRRAETIERNTRQLHKELPDIGYIYPLPCNAAAEASRYASRLVDWCKYGADLAKSGE